MKIKPLKTLRMPKKPSAGLRLCVKDLEMIEKDDRYMVYMGVWHQSDRSGKCQVCLGGARLARYHNDPSSTTFVYGDRRVRAMDFFRIYEFATGLACYLFSSKGNYDSYADGDIIQQIADTGIENRILNELKVLTSYEGNPEQFKVNMYKAADIMEKHGF